jgi:hypothetical protein
MVVEVFEDRRQRTPSQNGRGDFDMVPELGYLRLHTPEPFILKNLRPITPNAWLVQRYPEQFHQFGSPFLEVSDANQTICASINTDFFAACLGGRRDLGHHVVYFEPECAFYFKDSDNIFRSTTPEKLANQYRALIMKCAEEMPAQVHKLNLFHEFRSDKTSKAVVNRAKSILAASSDFFGVNSPHQRVRGPELHERIARKFVEELLTAAPGNVLLLADAYAVFLKLVKEQNLEPIKRPDFKAMVSPFMQEKFAICLRNDLKIDERSGVRGWKNVGFGQTVQN